MVPQRKDFALNTDVANVTHANYNILANFLLQIIRINSSTKGTSGEMNYVFYSNLCVSKL